MPTYPPLLGRIVLCALLSIGLSTPSHSAEPRTAFASSTSKVNAAFLAEIRVQAMRQLQLSASEVDALTSKLSSMNFNQVDGLIKGNASQLQQLIQAPTSSAQGGTQGAINQQGVSGATGGNRGESAFQQMQDLRGGFSQGRSGQAAEGGKAGCQACASPGMGTQNDTDPAGDESAKVVKLSAGGTAYVYPDGSFVIRDANGKQEVYDSKYQARDKDPRWTSNKTPVPDDDGGTRSGSITRDEWRGLLAKIGNKGAPEAHSNTGAGGMVLGRTTTTGNPIHGSTQRVVDTAQLQQIIRIAAEKFGPKIR